LVPFGRRTVLEVAQERGIDARLIVGACRFQEVFLARVEVAERLHAHGYTSVLIGKILKKDHSTILYYLSGRRKRRTKAMQIIGRVKLPEPIILATGDELTLNYIEIEGVVRYERAVRFAVIRPHRPITVTEAVLFETHHDGRYAIGAMVLEAATDTNVMPMKRAMGDE
jgi:hypothetical protein